MKLNESMNKNVNTSATKNYPSIVKWWLVVGVVMIIGQVVIGGITRLTGSGLSITKWEIVTGTLPPLHAAAWEEAFDLYKATPQYAKINEGMSMSDFKFIYFWEYFHRFWARLMGFVFAIPFVIFWRKGWLDKPLMRRLGMTVLLAAIVASFGWIMVASGLIERPWVNAYKLTMHLSLALLLYSYLLWTVFTVFQPQPVSFPQTVLKTWAKGITFLAAVQIILGGIMSGAKAGLFYPTWPDMNGEAIPGVLRDTSMWNVENFVNYDATLFLPALIQFLHRGLAYVLTIIVLYFVWQLLKSSKNSIIRLSAYLLVSVLVIQVSLGIFTLINCVGTIPVGLGVLHQAGAIAFLSAILFVDYQLLKSNPH
jgi:cytochrome c oxidase assembly protein subunit 15